MDTRTRLSESSHSPQYRIPVYRVALVREGSLSRLQRPRITAPTDAARLLHASLSTADREYLVALFLNQKNRVIGLNAVSVGSLTSSIVHPREVLEPAILANAAALIVGHNHPSGDPTPSAEDRAITTRLAMVGEALGIRLLDHLIIGDETGCAAFPATSATGIPRSWYGRGHASAQPPPSHRTAGKPHCP